jgi:hypothetical protein
MTQDKRICNLPSCNNEILNWRKNFCCKSHAGTFSAMSRFKDKDVIVKPAKVKKIKIAKPVAKKKQTRKEFMATFVGPIKIRRIRDALDPTDVRRICDRNAMLHLCTPIWANAQLIKEIYAISRKLTIETGVPHAVDHIVLLKHPLVCGLHNEFNLQVLSKTENSFKNNKFEV